MDEALAMIEEIGTHWGHLYWRVDEVISAMEKYQGSMILQYEALRTLLIRPCWRRRFQRQIGKGVATIVRLMELHKSSEDLQKMGCEAVCHIAHYSAEMKKRIAKEGGIAAVLRAMDLCKTSEGAQYYGCGALGNIAHNDAENQKRVAKEGGIAAVLRAMESYEMTEGVQERGCGALRYFAENNAENRTRIARERGIAAILRAMELHKTSKPVQEEGCWALAHLAANDAENQKRIAKEGGIATTLLAMSVYSTNEGIQVGGCATIGNLAMDLTNRSVLVQRGSVELIHAAMKRFEGYSNVSKQACWALYALAWQNSSNKEYIVNVVGTARIARAVGVVTGRKQRYKRIAKDIGKCLHAVDAFMKISIKDVDARYALLAALREVSTRKDDRDRRGKVAHPALRMYSTRNTGRTRYLLCCVTRFL